MQILLANQQIRNKQSTQQRIDIFNYNLGQKVGDKLTKLGKIGFSTKCFTADFLRFFNKKRQNLAFGWTTGYSQSNPSIAGIFLKFLISLKVH